MKKIGLLLILILVISATVFSEKVNPDKILWDGDVEITLDKNVYSIGEEITGVLRIKNYEAYPLVSQRIVLQLAKGEYSYPSQLSKNDNIVREVVISDLWTLPNTYEDIPFSIEGPSSGGDYRIDLYSWVVKSKFIGSSAIFISPKSIPVMIDGTEKAGAKIHREFTKFGRAIGPIGFPVNSGEKIDGQVYVQNQSEKTMSSLKIGLATCDWATAFCDNLDEEFFDVPPIDAKEGLAVDVSLIAPDLPSAYAIQITLYNGEEIESIYKSRVIVSGGTAKARKIYFDGLDTKDYSLSVVYMGSPDHFAYPDFNNFTWNIELSKVGNVVEEQQSELLSIKTGEIQQIDFNLESKDFDHVCVKAIKDSKIYQEECFVVDIKDIQKAYDEAHPPLVSVDWKYNENNETLTFSLDREGEMIDATIIIIDSEKTLYEENFSGKTKFETTINLKKGNYTMILDDHIVKKQQIIELFFNLSQKDLEDGIVGNYVPNEEPLVCEQTICEEGTTCAGVSYNTGEGSCCTTECINSSNILSNDILSVPLLVWVALILVIVAIMLGAKAYKKVKK